MVSGDDWTSTLEESLSEYAQRLEAADSPGRFRPCLEGTTALGQRVALGFSCFALKLYSILHLWDRLDERRRQQWIAFIQGFQVGNGAFVDRAVVYDASAYGRYPRQLLYHAYSYLYHPSELLHDWFGIDRTAARERVLIAETKQAIATLREVGCRSRVPYRGFPQTPDGIRTCLARLDWRRPWQAGGQAAALALFVSLEAPRFLDARTVEGLSAAMSAFFDGIVDPETGGYFKGPNPGYDELVNGAMKVLTAVDWLDMPIHYPERLIDSCLARLPSSAACHMVDAVYVLYRCGKLTPHRRADVQTYCRQALDRIQLHYNPDGGFSYKVGRSQVGYYGVQIARGLPESDLHGTVLLAWAISMIVEMLERKTPCWRIIKP